MLCHRLDYKIALSIAALIPALALPSCDRGSETDTILITIDTDLPTPEVASRTRIDLYTDEGRWFDSRDFDTSHADSFPVTFGVKKGFALRIRVRIYPEGHVRPYEGERFSDWPLVLSPTPLKSGERTPRLVGADGDRTPDTEPAPATAVDKLARVDTAVEQALRLRLYGACAGTMANLVTWESCDQAPRSRRRLDAARTPVTTPVPSLREPCSTSDADSQRVCVPGGVFVLGDRTDEVEFPSEYFLQVRAERLARVHKFWIDAQEITVGRYRKALARGFKPRAYGAAENDGAFKPLPTSAKACTYSAEPRGREDYALSCASWVTLRDLCLFEGGDLPTEAQWEYVARAAGRATAHRYPWGDADPACDTALFGRLPNAGCPEEPWPLELSVSNPQGAPPFSRDDTALHVQGLGGNLSEFVLDSVAEYTDSCWTEAPWDAATCLGPYPEPTAVTNPDLRRIARGGSWVVPPAFVRSTVRIRAAIAAPFYGARCAYATARP